MSKASIFMPAAVPLSIENVLETLKDKMLNISFDNGANETVFVVSALDGGNGIIVEMSDETKFNFEIRKIK